jgi:hypothetical protein
VLIGPETRGERESRGETGPKQSSALAPLIVIAFVCSACWLAIGLIVLTALMLSSGWTTPLLVVTALIAGAGIALIPALVYREKVKASDAALAALVAEASPQALLDASAREPELLVQIDREGLVRHRRRGE